MINLIYTPQRADIKSEYIVNDDILTVIVDDGIVKATEIFDFTGFEEGMAEEIITESLPVNPIISAEKIGDTVNITVIRFYDETEKELFENGEN